MKDLTKIKGVFTFHTFEEDKYKQLEPLLDKEGNYHLIDNFARVSMSYENQILRDGLKIFTASSKGFYECVSRLVAGNQTDPLASTYLSNQALQSPLKDLNFPKINIVNIVELTNGFQASFVFKRPRLSQGGTEITEIGIEVTNGIDFALLSRVVASPNQTLHQFSTTEDTIITYDLKFLI